MTVLRQMGGPLAAVATHRDSTTRIGLISLSSYHLLDTYELHQPSGSTTAVSCRQGCPSPVAP